MADASSPVGSAAPPPAQRVLMPPDPLQQAVFQPIAHTAIPGAKRKAADAPPPSEEKWRYAAIAALVLVAICLVYAIVEGVRANNYATAYSRSLSALTLSIRNPDTVNMARRLAAENNVEDPLVVLAKPGKALTVDEDLQWAAAQASREWPMRKPVAPATPEPGNQQHR